MTTVKILDYHPTAHVNVEAEVKFPEEDGVVQVENFGIHFSKQGTLVYGMRLESIGARLANDISVDLLCRVLSDVHEVAKPTAKLTPAAADSHPCDLIRIAGAGACVSERVVWLVRIRRSSLIHCSRCTSASS